MTAEPDGLLIVDAERYPDGARINLRVRDGRIAAVGKALRRARGETCIQAAGGALLPGLHDHHMHLLALAAARESVPCGPPQVDSLAALGRALGSRPGRGWLRGVGYHESVAGPLDRYQLDTLVPERPVRVQHASGKLWIVNSAGALALDLDRYNHLDGVECGTDGVPTGRMFRLDGWLRERLAAAAAPELRSTSAALAGYGVTGITDTSPDNDVTSIDLFARSLADGALLQRVRLMGSEQLTGQPADARLVLGELKVLLDEDDLPDLDELVDRVRRTHDLRRGLAFHCVSRVELVFALHVLREAGPRLDRIEHASVVAPDLFPLLRQLGATVVTQPGFILERGDRYLADAEPDELPHLYRLRSFLEQGIPLGLSTDAPYGEPDPWRAMQAAVRRATRAGRLVDPAEALTPEAALAGFLAPGSRPGGASRRLSIGDPADFCLLDRPWHAARELLESAMVRLTVAAGRIVYERA